jgi:hypothetical protein
MRSILVKLRRGEKGQALLLTMILLLVGSLIVVSLLIYMGSGVKVGKDVHEERMDELYAADAGVMNAFWHIKTIADGIPEAVDDPPLQIADILNGKTVDPIIITYIDEKTYKINSTAKSDTGSQTEIECYLSILKFRWLLDNAITSIEDVEISNGTTVEGDVQYNGTLDNKGEINGEENTDPIPVEDWPDINQISDFYWEDVKGAVPYPEELLLANDYSTWGPFYRNGNLTFDNHGQKREVTLTGTIYIDGDLVFNEAGKGAAYTIDLNMQTIFVAGGITFPPQFCTLKGSGCIIAVNDIIFQPAILADESNYIFVMSLGGQIWFKPQGTFYGSLCGNTIVDLQPNCNLEHTEPPDGLNLPGESEKKNVITSINTWEITLD